MDTPENKSRIKPFTYFGKWEASAHPLQRLGIFLILLLFCACSDWNDIGTETIPDGTKTENNIGITFKGKVVSSQQATRANNTIVNLNETTLPATAASTFYAGLFGCHTGQYTWQQLVGLSLQESPTDAQKEILKNHYTANLLYNAKATIGADGTLTYEPVRFWPNTPLTSDATQHEYCTFWGYYPYNPTAEIGEYGITLIPEELGEGTGMGRVKFTMQPDAAEQNDFMISTPAVDCNRDGYPLVEGPQGTYTPKPVSLRFHHMLAQVRLYAFIRGTDRMVYQDDNNDGIDDVADAAWFDSWADNGTIMDAYGNVYTKKGADAVERTTQKEAFPTEFAANLTKDEFLALDLKVPAEEQCERWDRTGGTWDVNHTRRRANITYQMVFNNIKTSTTFFPAYDASTGSASIAYEPATTLGSATVTEYIMNPYWFHFNANEERDYLDDDFMFGKFEDTWASEDGNKLNYTLGDKNVDKNTWIDNEDHSKGNKHYNYAPGNILLVVPQVLDDDDVPHIVLTAKGEKAGDSTTEYTARLTINMLKMNIEWKSSYIYCYAILDDLRPGDDIVRGPESITTIFDTNQYTDQW